MFVLCRRLQVAYFNFLFIFLNGDCKVTFAVRVKVPFILHCTKGHNTSLPYTIVQCVSHFVITQQMDYGALSCLLAMKNVVVDFVASDCVAVDCGRVGF